MDVQCLLVITFISEKVSGRRKKEGIRILSLLEFKYVEYFQI